MNEINPNIGFYPFRVVRIPPPLALNGWPDTRPILSHIPFMKWCTVTHGWSSRP